MTFDGTTNRCPSLVRETSYQGDRCTLGSGDRAGIAALYH